MLRLRSSLASVWLFALFWMAASAARAQGPNWQLINTPSTGPGVSTHGTAPPPASEPDHLYLLNGTAGVHESPLPESFKEDLAPLEQGSGGGLSGEEEDIVYIVGQEIVEGIVASEAAGVLTPEVEAIAEPLDGETSASGVTANGLFGECATHERTTSRSVSLNGKTWSKTFGDAGDAFTGTYSLSGQLEGSVTAELKFGIKRRKVVGKCVPYGLEFRSLRAFGNARSDGGITLNGTLNYSDTFGPWDIAKPELYDVVFYVGPVPVRIILNMPITAGLALTANVAGSVNYNGTHVATGTFDYTCTLSTCTGSNNFDNTPENGNTQQITGNVEGRVKPVPHVDIGFRGVLYAEWFAYAQIGVRPHLLGDLWGYAGNTCGDADGDGDFETVRALTFDLDRRIDLTRESRLFNRDPKRGTIRTGAVVHMGFYDLVNSNAMQPYLLGLPSIEVNDTGAYKVRMRPCWPYTEQVTYKINWDDGSPVAEPQGAPGTEVTASHAWTEAGSKTVTATAARDAHGRAMDESYSRTITVTPPIPLTVTSTPSPMSATFGNPITWTLTPTGGHAATIQYAMARRRVGTTAWVPDPFVWQAGNVLTWLPNSEDVGTWEIAVGVKDRNTPAVPGYSAYVNPGNVQVVAPLTLSCSGPSPAAVTHGNPVTWSATTTGGTPGTIQFLLSRRIVGTSTWYNHPNGWQTSNVFSWTPAASEVGTWQVNITVKDVNSPPATGYTATCNTGNVSVGNPLNLTVTPSPASRPHNDSRLITWTATASGGVPGTLQYAFFRRRAGATDWTPSVSSPAWQTSNTFSWDPSAADVGTWETYVWVKDSATPAGMNTYGYAAGYNSGPVTITAPLCLSATPSPAYVSPGTAITWTATPCGGYPATTELALFRRRAGTTAWIPDATAPAWQSGNVFTWTPGTADTGTWEVILWVRDDDTPPSPGYGATYNPGNVQVVAPLTLTVTPSPASRPHDDTRLVTWTATATGGIPGTIQYAFFRRRAGTTPWTPSVSSPAWQASNTFSWDPTAADVGTWETYVWVKDSATPASMNTYGYAAGYNSGPIAVTAPLCLSSTASPAIVNTGTAITWTATPCGGYPPTTELAMFRRRVGTTSWIPDVSAPAWQSGNVFTWTPGAADTGTWEVILWVRDDDTPPSPGYGATYNPGNVQVVTPLTVTGSGSPQYATSGNTISWTANISGGTPATYRYAFFRRRAGATAWIPDVTAPAWQTGNVMSWTPTSADAGTWEIIIWAKDGNTPANANTYGYAAYYNAGPVQVVTPTTLTGTSSPSVVYHGTSISWTANASGGIPSTRQYAFFRRRVGDANWTPSVSSPAWQNSSSFSWTPSSAQTGTWEIVIWVRDSSTSPTQNTYGYAAYYNAGPVQVVNPPSLSVTGSPSSAYYGQTISWNANVSGGTGTSVRYAFFRRRAGDANWSPSIYSPAWQTSSSYSWTPGSGDVGTWETYVWVKDSATPSNMNGYGYAAGFNSGPVQIVAPAPLTVSGSGSPSTSPAGTTITWYANANGGVPSTIRYALFRRKAGTSNWIPDVTSPSWQSSSALRWTPSSSDVGTWEIIIWVKDVNTSSTQNTYGFASYYNAGPVQVY